MNNGAFTLTGASKHVLTGVLLLIVFVVAQPLQADNIFVSQAANASDDNPGTSSLPLETIAEGVSRAAPGDSVVVLSGDYRQENSGYGVGVIPVVNRSGALGSEIRIVGQDEPRIGSFLIRDSSHIRVTGFRAAGSDFFAQPNWNLMPTIVRDVPADQEPPIDYTSDFEDRREAVEAAFATYFSIIEDLEFSSAFDVLTSSHITLNHNFITGYWSGIQCRGASNIRISANRIVHCVNGIFTFDPAPGLSNSLIIGNIVSQSLDTGIFIRRGSTNVRLLNNSVRFSGINHISLAEGCTNCRVTANRVSFGGYYSETMQFPGSSAISLNDCGTGNDVAFNVALRQVDLTGIDGNGMILDFMQEDAQATVRWNCSAFNMGSGLNLTASPGSRIHFNMFSNNGFLSTTRRNGAGIKFSREQDIGNRITQNLFYLNSEAGLISTDTLQFQELVEFNCYVTQFPVPLAWDAYNDGESSYETLEEMQTETGWELQGKAEVLGK